MTGRRSALALLAVLLGGGLWVAYPRAASLTAFAPDRMAEVDAAMWRDYYDKHYVSLFWRLYSLNRVEFGFSPFDSLRVAVFAAVAARQFQPTQSRQEANAAMPMLARYYAVLAGAAPSEFDPAQAALLELDWWQARRENVPPETYGLTIARTSSLIYGVDSPPLREAGVLRAKAMAYRDAHGDRMSEADWREVTDQLVAAYRTLKVAIAGARGG